MPETFWLEKEASSTAMAGTLLPGDVSQRLGSFQLPVEASWQYLFREKVPAQWRITSNIYSGSPIESRAKLRLSVSDAIACTDVEPEKTIVDPEESVITYYYNPTNLDATRVSLENYLASSRERHQKSWVDFFSSPLSKKYETALRYVISRLCSFGRLHENWDGEGAKPVSWMTISRALSLFTSIVMSADKVGADLPIPSVSPLPDGGIEFEFETLFKELMVAVSDTPGAPLNYLTANKSELREQLEEGELGEGELVKLAVNWFE